MVGALVGSAAGFGESPLLEVKAFMGTRIGRELAVETATEGGRFDFPD